MNGDGEQSSRMHGMHVQLPYLPIRISQYLPRIKCKAQPRDKAWLEGEPLVDGRDIILGSAVLETSSQPKQQQDWDEPVQQSRARILWSRSRNCGCIGVRPGGPVQEIHDSCKNVEGNRGRNASLCHRFLCNCLAPTNTAEPSMTRLYIGSSSARQGNGICIPSNSVS